MQASNCQWASDSDESSFVDVPLDAPSDDGLA
jgi:hypothetical protein